jgi:hypothetical protein
VARTVAEMTPGQAVEFALRVMLEQGFSSKYYKNWKEVAEADYSETDSDFYENYSLTEREGAWGAFEYVDTKQSYVSDGITVKYEGNQNDGPAHSNSEYFVVFSLEDATGKRYFQRDGYYTSYEGGNLVEADDSEVQRFEKTVTYWRSA